MTAKPLIAPNVKIGSIIREKSSDERFKVTNISYDPEEGCILEVDHIINSSPIGLYRDIFADEFSDYEIVDNVCVE